MKTKILILIKGPGILQVYKQHPELSRDKRLVPDEMVEENQDTTVGSLLKSFRLHEFRLKLATSSGK